MNNSLDYLNILKALMELPFQVGKNLLIDFLNGDYKNKSITKNRLDELNHFESLLWEKEKLSREIDKLVANGMIEFTTSDYNRFVKILSITIKGQNEIINPTLPSKKLANKIDFKKTEINEKDRIRFNALKNFLERFNDEQKKAIISENQNILCVAGAGSGKTTVLTKRIEFLSKYKNLDEKKILAITFTRKARKEMEKRLDKLEIKNVAVHTFNSFCEKILRQHENEIYGREIRIQGYGDKILAMNMALGSIGLNMEDALDGYFTPSQRKFKTGNQMANSFMNDCFSVMDYFKISGEKEYNFSKNVDAKNKNNAERIYKITQYLKEHMKTQGLRDYSDQIIDAIKFLKNNPINIPNFQHILIDEYQDVNAMQIELIKLLNAPNLFVVGDPRQSIFGWRGSNINYILNFEKNHPKTEIIHLRKNYRSTKKVVEFMNHSIREMGLPDLEYHHDFSDTEIKILNFENEEAERMFVIRNILDKDIPNKEIFILARTNRQLMELSQLMKRNGINHVVKTDEIRNPVNSTNKDITLATIHAIKGLEAKKVFVIGANEQNFPCKASDHPAIEMIKTDNYDKEEEERRLFYVAVSRAKEILYITYSGKKPSYFINDEMQYLCDTGANKKEQENLNESIKIVNQDIVNKLKNWRNILSENNKVPAYTILTNATINSIGTKTPKNSEELFEIDGIGPLKLTRYGTQILEIVEEFTQ